MFIYMYNSFDKINVKTVKLYSFVTVFTLSCKMMLEATVKSKKSLITTYCHFASELGGCIWLAGSIATLL